MTDGLTGRDNYFEDFAPGMVMRHARGKTVEAAEHVMITNLVMNTSQGHFNEDAMKDNAFGQRITFGGYTAALVVGAGVGFGGRRLIGFAVLALQ